LSRDRLPLGADVWECFRPRAVGAVILGPRVLTGLLSAGAASARRPRRSWAWTRSWCRGRARDPGHGWAGRRSTAPPVCACEASNVGAGRAWRAGPRDRRRRGATGPRAGARPSGGPRWWRASLCQRGSLASSARAPEHTASLRGHTRQPARTRGRDLQPRSPEVHARGPSSGATPQGWWADGAAPRAHRRGAAYRRTACEHAGRGRRHMGAVGWRSA
jgi:hypothetical protein